MPERKSENIRKRFVGAAILLLFSGFAGCSDSIPRTDVQQLIEEENEDDRNPGDGNSLDGNQKGSHLENGNLEGENLEVGNSENGNSENQNPEGGNAEAPSRAEESDEIQQIMSSCIQLYREAAESGKGADLDTVRRLVDCFGENGYPAVDSGNQVDMVCGEKVIQFCQWVEEQAEGDLTVIEVTYTWGFTVYDLHTEEGKVDVVRSYYRYEDGEMKKKAEGRYQAEYWDYTEEGYLLFSGTWVSEESYVLVFSSTEDHVALRVQPLEERCRELNRQYLLPIGYERNNMFLTDWSEEDFGELNFYDLYDAFYPIVTGDLPPYKADSDLSAGAVYQIPKDAFESVIMTFLKIDSKTLQSKTLYHTETAAYEYRPRGFYEIEYPEYPYPEVVDFMEKEDGTIALTVHVVFPHGDDAKVYAHEVVVRPLEEGGVQYVSNHVVPSDENEEAVWHNPRMTDEEWEEWYGDFR